MTIITKWWLLHKINDFECSDINSGVTLRHQYPSGFSLLTQNSNPRRVCDTTGDSYYTCPNTSFSIHGMSCHNVYGRIIAYQNGYPIAFHKILIKPMSMEWVLLMVKALASTSGHLLEQLMKLQVTQPSNALA